MSQNSRKRAYQDGCAVAHALDIIGDRWAMPIMRELMLGPKRFTDLRAGLPATQGVERPRTEIVLRENLP